MTGARRVITKKFCVLEEKGNHLPIEYITKLWVKFVRLNYFITFVDGASKNWNPRSGS